MSGTEQRGVCEGGKKPTARSINRILKLFESFKIRSVSKNFRKRETSLAEFRRRSGEIK